VAAPESGSPRYRLGPRSTRGLVAGWRTGQIACVAIGLILAVGFLRAVSGAAGGLLALVAAGGGVAVAAWPIGGRTPEQWAPTLLTFAVRSCAEGSHRPWQAPGRRHRGPISRLSLVELPEPGFEPPAWRENLDVLSPRARLGRRSGLAPGTSPGTSPAPWRPSGIGVLADAECGTWTALLPVSGTGFALLSDDERGERIAAWAGVLAAMARDTSRLHRLQWLSTAYPAWLDGAMAGGGRGLPGEGYGRLLGEAAPDLWAHEIHVAVTVRQRRPGRGSAEDAAVTLREQLSALEDRLRAAGLAPGVVLSPLELAGVLRKSFEVAPSDPPAALPWPWPLGTEDQWSRLRTDASWQATYWVAEWPRCEVGGGFLLPMLLEPGLRRVVSVTMAPLPVLTAVRRAERDRTEGTADAELRHRHGFAVTARAVREQESRQQREAELAEGHAGYRYSGYVTVTEADQEALERACGRLERSAALAQLELRRLYGAQEEGYCCTLPAGRGCR
jgi:hypothetical protein